MEEKKQENINFLKNTKSAWNSEKANLILDKAMTGIVKGEQLPNMYSVWSFSGKFRVRAYIYIVIIFKLCTVHA